MIQIDLLKIGQKFRLKGEVWEKTPERHNHREDIIFIVARNTQTGSVLAFPHDHKVELTETESLNNRMYYAISDLVTDVEDGETELLDKAQRPYEGMLDRLRNLKAEFERNLLS